MDPAGGQSQFLLFFPTLDGRLLDGWMDGWSAKFFFCNGRSVWGKLTPWEEEEEGKGVMGYCPGIFPGTNSTFEGLLLEPR